MFMITQRNLRWLNSSPELKVLLPKKRGIESHIYRAQLQAAIWRSYTALDPPDLNPLHYGWRVDPEDDSLMPISLPDDVSAVPLEILQMIKCGCNTCSTSRCSCFAAQLSCSVFCSCYSTQEYNNQHTILTMITPAEDNAGNE